MITFEKYVYAWLMDLEINLKYVYYLFFNMQ